MARRQVAMVIDLNKCLGCQTCSMACKTQWTNRNGREYMYWNHVETLPGKGYPRGWQESGGGFDPHGEARPGRIPSLEHDYGIPFDLNYEAALGARGAAAKDGRPWLGPIERPLYGPNWDEDVGEGEYPNSYYFYLPRLCNHCSNPACLKACPRKAIYKREEDGIVLVDQSRCRGYQHCVAACPYKKVYFNPSAGRSEKCIFCYPRVEQGVAPACARQCPGRVRFAGFLDDETSAVHKLTLKWKVALPLRADFGTGPNVYYVPPLSPAKYDERGETTGEPRIPVELLIRLFGPEVLRVLETLRVEMAKKREGGDSELLDLLIAYRHEEMFSFNPAGKAGNG